MLNSDERVCEGCHRVAFKGEVCRICGASDPETAEREFAPVPAKVGKLNYENLPLFVARA